MLPPPRVHPAALEPGDEVRLLRLLRRSFLKAQCGKKTRIQHRGKFSLRGGRAQVVFGYLIHYIPLPQRCRDKPRPL